MTRTGRFQAICHRVLRSALVCAAGWTLVIVGCSSESAMVRQMRKVRLIETLRETLLESVEAEKSAVLATTDEESKSMAQEARQSADATNRLRTELRALIVADGRQVEVDKLNAFDAAWAEVERVDQRLLDLAVANTNLKAGRLAATEAESHLDRLVEILEEVGASDVGVDASRALSSAAIAALRIQPLLLVHIPSADDAEMTRLEQRMQSLNEEVDRNLAAATAAGVSADKLATATQEWHAYQAVLKNIVQLSRQNSNVISFDVSVHQKRDVTKKCLAALSALLEAVDVGPKSVR